jgi:hypothetical protein
LFKVGVAYRQDVTKWLTLSGTILLGAWLYSSDHTSGYDFGANT